MIAIENLVYRDLNTIADEHYFTIESVLHKRISKYLSTEKRIGDFIALNLKSIIVGKPQVLFNTNTAFESLVTNKNQQPAKEIIKKIFNYSSFISSDKNKKNLAYELAKKLSLNTCPYCNRNYTVTVFRKKGSTDPVVRPDFDHFFPKNKYPLLALSFYNLVPCCNICNSRVKGTKEMHLNKHIHPYIEGFGTALKFNYKPKDVASMTGESNNLEINFIEDATQKDKAKRCRENVQDLELNAIYNVSHNEEVAEIIRKFHISGGRYIEILAKQFPQLGTAEQLYKIAFANYYNDSDFEKRPLSKLTKDITDQLGFIYPGSLNK